MPKQRTFSPIPTSDVGGIPRDVRANKLSVPLVMPKLKPISHGDESTPPGTPPVSSSVQAGEQTHFRTVDKHSNNVLEAHIESEYTLIDAGLIDQNSHPPRTIYLDENIKIIADSMIESGQRDAIHVIPNPTKPGRFIIGDGWTRVLATRSYNINDNKVLAKIHTDLTEEQASWLGYSQNKDRTPPTDLDLAAYYKGWNDKGMTWDEVANRAGVSSALMSYFAAFNRLDTEILALIKTSPQRFTANAAYHLSRLQVQAGCDAALNMANRFLMNEQSIRQLKANVDEALQRLGRAKNARGNSNRVMLQRAFPGGQFRQRKNGLVEMTATVPEDRINYFNSKLEELLKEVLVPNDASPGDGDHSDSLDETQEK